MDKTIRTVVLLVILVGAGVAIWAYTKQPAETPGPPAAEIRSNRPVQPAPRPEEKVGVTTETLGP